MSAVARYFVAVVGLVVVVIVGSVMVSGLLEARAGRVAPPPRIALPGVPLPPIRLPGATSSPAGVYGWEASDGYQTAMHKVVGPRESTVLAFAIGPDCLKESEGQQRVPVSHGELWGVSVEPYEPPVLFSNRKGDETTRAYALAVGERTLCAYVTRHERTTTNDEWQAAIRAVESLRLYLKGNNVRIYFTLDSGWDTS